MDDPASEISRLLAAEQVTVRKPEQGTAPKLFYIHGSAVALHPTATERAPAAHLWSDVIPLHPLTAPRAPSRTPRPAAAPAQAPAVAPECTNGTARPTSATAVVAPSQAQGVASSGPIHIGRGRMAERLVQVAYNAQHVVPWHWPVPAYLVTKAIGSGLFLWLALGIGLQLALRPMDAIAAGLVALLMLAVTAGLLVYDLDRPERFVYILRRPQWRSWLTRGAFFLLGFSIVGGVWWFVELAGALGWIAPSMAAALRAPFLWAAAPFAIGAAIYTAFLFGQAEGRDLWQSSLLPVHLLLQAGMVGAAALLVLDFVLGLDPAWQQAARLGLGVTLALDLGVILLGEFGMPHASEAAAQAAHAIRHGPYRTYFWIGAILIGHVAPLLLLWPGAPGLDALAGLATIAGLYAFEYAFVLAPQEVPNS
jgi:formate-dependent nitrite reductase membrane component NrfD